VLTTQSEKLGRVDSRTERARRRLFREDEVPPPAPAGLGIGVEPREWVRERKRRRASALFGSIRQEGKQ